ncbi:SDR family oxidoreductase [Solimonas sp. K1W22B-7]|uniref:SDR family oxidoreductase n=1 Tax=Solimonas sp. K1W22B-7 TaxID=2303331 RepID=UPI000E33396E|nr:SDR family oxidoreductase [Solimonas sp. K1W22B-7]AXQ31436.1 SDR family oxidoreductase [Solimonas sp. K1W22B-7]
MTRSAILITGAAAGIGRACAERFAREGWFVGVCDIDEAGASALARQFGAQGWSAKLDVTDPAAWDATLAAFFAASGGRLDVLLNNAGVLVSGAFGDIPLAKQHWQVDVNFKGVINGCHAALPYLKQTPGARLINMASASAIYGAPSLAVYSATKFAVRGLTEALQVEWQPLGVAVMDIWPLYVRTAMIDAVGAGSARSLDSMGVRLTPQNVADTVWRAANRPGRTHWTVGLQAWAMDLATRLSPRALTRRVVAWLSGF